MFLIGSPKIGVRTELKARSVPVARSRLESPASNCSFTALQSLLSPRLIYGIKVVELAV
jgi:hypothetical protein